MPRRERPLLAGNLNTFLNSIPAFIVIKILLNMIYFLEDYCLFVLSLILLLLMISFTRK